jgi:hypothetical protein
VRGALNSTLSFTTSAVVLCVHSMLREQIPNTAGIFGPLTIIAPPGTVVNGVMPAASSMRGITGFRIIDTVLGALSGMLPDRVPAAGEGGNSLVIIGGLRPDRSSYVYYELLAGAVERYHLAPHYSRISNNHEARDETQEHAIITFEGGRLGIFHWTNVGYDSPLRWWRSSRFLLRRAWALLSA